MTPTTPFWRRKNSSNLLADVAPVLVIFLIFAVLAVTVDHSGEFPLNDDWGFSTPLLWYSEGEGAHATYWQSMPYLTQLGIGILWVELVGFSYECLRTLTLIQAALTITLSYGVARTVGLDRVISLLLPLAVAVSPVFIGLSFSFMSDISGAAFSVAACFFLALSIKGGTRGHVCFFIGGLMLLCAIAIRQNSLSIALAFFLTHLLFFRQDGARPFGALALVVAGAATYAATVPFMKATIGLPGDYGLETLKMVALLRDLADFRLGALLPAVKSILHLYVGAGALLLPLTPLLIGRSRGQRTAFWVVLPMAALVAVAALLLDQSVLSSTKGDILSSDGIGPRLIRGDPQEVPTLSVALTLAGSMVTSLLLFLAAGSVWRSGVRAVGEHGQARIGVFLILCGLGIYAPHGLVYGPLFDRYLLVPTILIGIGVFALIDRCSEPGRPPLPVLSPMVITSVVLVLVTLAGSAAMTEDFFRWQRARYDMIDRASVEFSATAETFSGGFEYDNLVRIIGRPDTAKDIVATGDWNAALFLAHSHWSGGEVLETVRVDTVLPFGSSTITLRRSSE